MSKVQELRELGFDKSYAIPFKKAWKVRCSQCQAICINGHPCHETGCPNQYAAMQDALEEQDDY